MQPDALDVLQVLRQRLGREPSYVELLQELGHAPSGLPLAGPGQVACPTQGSALLGQVESDEGLTACLQAIELREAHPELAKLRAGLVHQLLFGSLPQSGGGLASIGHPRPSRMHGPGAATAGVGVLGMLP